MLTGLRDTVGGDALTCIVNVADDETIYGLEVSPDLDTVMYHLAGLTDWEQGWGIAGDTFVTMTELNARSGNAWFRLGDRDLATHLARTIALREGMSLTAITAHLSRQLGIDAEILPVTDDHVHTFLLTEDGPIPFQKWFVAGRASTPVSGLEFRGATQAVLSPSVHSAIESAEMIVICPSNPMLSIDPMLAIPGMKELLRTRRERVVAVSPIIDGQALRGPAARLFSWLGTEPSVVEIVRRYRDLASRFVCDSLDVRHRDALSDFGVDVLHTDTIMVNEKAAGALACRVIEWMRS